MQHKIGKWSEFEGIFGSDENRRRMLGSESGKVLRSADAPDELSILFEWDWSSAGTDGSALSSAV